MHAFSFKRTLILSLVVAFAFLLVATPVDAASVITSKATFAPGEPIVVSFADFPGNSSDWINIVPVGSDDTEWGYWSYTNGAQKGFMSFKGQVAGSYEVRGYYDYSGTGSYVVQARYRFSVR